MSSQGFDDLINKFDLNVFAEEEIQEICANLGLRREEFCDSFSHYVANEFSLGNLPFDVADAAMNNLAGSAFVDLPPYSMSIYQAFDAGEYLGEHEPPGTNPVEKYTRPLIREILASHFSKGRA